MAETTIPRWLRIILICDRTGSAWYVGTGFFFAPILAMVSPWPAVTAALWVMIGLAGLWLGLLGLAMATGLAMVLRAGGEIGDDYWRSVIDLPTAPDADRKPSLSGRPDTPSRCNRPASA
ncbi:hypothetical protein [Mycobacterium kyogaense]|uniref:hypothetical protein n=1 Tax=Mycobacterium kyogaense TaxID=2212479 RepID=UPI000DAC9446|nr:hypothetical protein [Mycobacterium kyogaense]